MLYGVVMADRIDREINEILEKLGDEPEQKGKPRKPIPISSVRRKAQPPSPGTPKGPLFPRIEPATLMFSGAGIMLVGLVLSSFVDALIWAAFAGVLMFIAAFLISFARGWPQTPQASGRPAEGVYWRDRYIQYDGAGDSSWDRIKRKFRR